MANRAWPTGNTKTPGFDRTSSGDGKSFPDFLKHVALSRSQREDERQEGLRVIEKRYKTGYVSAKTNAVRKSAMGEESGTLGGYTVPPEYSFQILTAFNEINFIRKRALVLPMKSATLDCGRLDVETVPASVGVSPLFGGIKLQWGSSQPPAETEPKFRNTSLKAWDLLGFVTLSRDLSMDTGKEGEDALFKIFGEGAAWAAEYAFFQGTGTDGQMPLGFLNCPALATPARNGPTAIAAKDISGMAASLLPYSWKRSIWACSPTAFGQIAQITNYYINTDDAEEGTAGYLMGRPLYVTEKLPALGTTGDLMFIDPSLYVIGDRQQVVIDVSEHTLFQTNQIVWRIWLRLDGKPLFSKSITLQDGSTVVSAYVALHS